MSASPLALLFEIYLELARCFVQAVSLCLYSLMDAVYNFDYVGCYAEYSQRFTALAEPVVLECVFCVNRNIVYTHHYLQQQYNRNAVFAMLTDAVYCVLGVINRAGVWIYRVAMFARSEPPNEWMSFHYLTGSPTHHFVYNEKYLIFEEEDVEIQIENMDGILTGALINIFMGKHYLQMLGDFESPHHSQVSSLLTDETANNVAQTEYAELKERTNDSVLMVVRKNDAYTSRVLSPNTHAFFQLSCEKSSVRFMMVRYLHPLMNAPLPIHLNAEYFYENNEILSHAFILRYLEYLPRNMKYIFDNNYLVELIDSNFQLVRLRYGQHIVLKTDNYSVINI